MLAPFDGAGTWRILSSVILLQSIPVVTVVALLPFFYIYIWNKTRHSSLYLGVSSNLQQLPCGVQRSRHVLPFPAPLHAG